MSQTDRTPERPLIHVACGVLQRPSGEVLLAQRPEGKIAAGYWEFPGGKIEPGEAPFAALCRELDEELGVQVHAARPLIRFRHDYSNRSVVLDTWCVTGFSPDPSPREGQALDWVLPAALPQYPQTLPTVAPSARALVLPDTYVFTPPGITQPALLAGLEHLPPRALLRLRLPGLDDAAYGELAAAVLLAARASGLRVLLDRSPAQVVRLGADGWHASSTQLANATARALPADKLVLASCHDVTELERAQRLGCDAVVIGSVAPTVSHPGAEALGWPGFTQLADASALPAYAIGGLRPDDRERAFAAYAQGVAGISAYWSN